MLKITWKRKHSK